MAAQAAREPSLPPLDEVPLRNRTTSTTVTTVSTSTMATVGSGITGSGRDNFQVLAAAFGAAADEELVDPSSGPATTDTSPPPAATAASAVREFPRSNDDGDRSDGDESRTREDYVDADVAEAAAAPAARGPSPSPPSSTTSLEQQEEEEEEMPGMVCGVPVAHPIIMADCADASDVPVVGLAADNEGEGGGENVGDSDVNDSENASVSGEEGEDSDAPHQNVVHHLQYLNVTMATMDQNNTDGDLDNIIVATLEDGLGEQARGLGIYDVDVNEGDKNEEDSPPNTSSMESMSSTGAPGGSAEKVSPWNDRSKQLWGAILVIGCCTALISLALTRRTRNIDGLNNTAGGIDAAGNAAVPTSPTPSPTPEIVYLLDTNSPLLSLLDPFLKTTESRDHMIQGSPQRLAVEWLNATSWGALDHFDLGEWEDAAVREAVPLDFPLAQEERLIQRYALAVLWYSTVGELNDEREPVNGWKDRANFLSASHECEWISAESRLGVTCDEDRRVLEIFLKENDLSGVIPSKELHALTNLQKLDLSNNGNIKGPLPKNLGHLTELRQLHLGQNSLTGTIPAEYGALTKLEDLSLENNELTGSVPSEVSDMKSLTSIWLNHNSFTDGMDNFCRDDMTRITLFYSDCFCKTYPKLEPEAPCSCCTICCTQDRGVESCHPNVQCGEE